MMSIKFTPFPKIPRLSKECIITEKIDGTNASVWIDKIEAGDVDQYDPNVSGLHVIDGNTVIVRAGSRNRFVTPENDNYNFAKWVTVNSLELIHELGLGVHYGEWWGSGIQRGYGLQGGVKNFSLFNTDRWIVTGKQ